jgi:hypothetical protein
MGDNHNHLAELLAQAQQAVANAAQAAQGYFAGLGPDPSEHEPVGQAPQPVTRKVLNVIYNPRVPSQQNRKLSEVMGWNDPDQLIAGHMADLKQVSHGYANFVTAERVEVDRFPVKTDGFAYTPDDFVAHLKSNSGFHTPDDVDYYRILSDFDVINKINRGAIDEVWLHAFPYAGFYESRMCGPDAFFCNAPPLDNTGQAHRKFIIMGYNYQRGLGEMLEDMGHRTESIMRQVFRNKHGNDNLFERFGRYDKIAPGQAEVGIVHYAPNSVRDYDWGNMTKVPSTWYVWNNFPNLDGAPVIVDATVWGGGEIRAHHVWWTSLLPHITGGAGGVAYNWWKYVVDPNTVR